MELSNPHSPKMIEAQTPSAKISAYSSARLASGRSSGPGSTMHYHDSGYLWLWHIVAIAGIKIQQQSVRETAIHFLFLIRIAFPQIGTIAHIDTSMISNATTGTKHVCTLCSSNWGSRPWLFSKITPSYVIGFEKGLEIKSKSKLNNLIFDLFTWFQHARNQSAQTLKGAHAGSGQHEKLNQGLNHDSRTS